MKALLLQARLHARPASPAARRVRWTEHERPGHRRRRLHRHATCGCALSRAAGPGRAAVTRATHATPSSPRRSPRADVVFHLAGVNRPQDPAEFTTGNAGFTAQPVRRAARRGPRGARRRSPRRSRPSCDNPYGASKRAAEERAAGVRARRPARRWPSSGCPTCSASGAGPTTTRPSPPSATTSPAACRSASTTRPPPLRLVYIDDVVAAFAALPGGAAARRRASPTWRPVYDDHRGRARATDRGLRATRARSLADRARRRRASTRALYATYVSYLPPEALRLRAAEARRRARRVRRRC